MMHKSYLDKKKGFFVLIISFIVSLIYPVTTIAYDSKIEYKIKAGYIYNFTKFVFWPENESQTFNICIVGKDPFGSIINPIENRNVGDKPIRLFRYQSINQVTNCHIVYFGRSEKLRDLYDISLNGILTIYSAKGSLTVSESKQFTKVGGMISFFLKKGKVKLHINLKALKKSGLEVSAKLLEVAEIYEGEPGD